jgi:membrane-anchored glycerophosphoryl diester phosphodiesterase (GDPDase)
MSSSLNDPSPLRPLSVGNVVTAGFQLYRSHLKDFFKIGLFAYLWTIIPIYGWAKFAMNSGLIARLAFADLTHQPETLESARREVTPRLWSFLSVAFRFVGLLILLYIGVLVLLVGGVLVLASVGRAVLGEAGGLLVGLWIVAGLIGGAIALLIFMSRWIVAEVPLAIETGVNGSQSIDRSWMLTKNSVGRIQLIVAVAFLVTLPITAITGYLPQIFLIGIDAESPSFGLVYLISTAASLVGGAIVLPFWQCIKAVLYYDLRSRKEGLDLQLGQSTPEMP